MSHALRTEAAFSIGETDVTRLGRLRWLPSALIGLGGPLALVLVVFPQALEHGQALLIGILMAMLIVCVAAYALTVLFPGDVTGVAVDRENRQFEIVREGAFAMSSKALAFDEVADIRMSTHCDRDGYSMKVAEIVTFGGANVVLPSATTTTEIAALRRAAGLAVSKR
jgi:hypothetical protein